MLLLSFQNSKIWLEQTKLLKISVRTRRAPIRRAPYPRPQRPETETEVIRVNPKGLGLTLQVFPPSRQG